MLAAHGMGEHESEGELLGQRGGRELLRDVGAGTDSEMRWATREEARRAIFRYIETWYNRERHSTLDYVSPAAYEERLGRLPNGS